MNEGYRNFKAEKNATACNVSKTGHRKMSSPFSLAIGLSDKFHKFIDSSF